MPDTEITGFDRHGFPVVVSMYLDRMVLCYRNIEGFKRSRIFPDEDISKIFKREFGNGSVLIVNHDLYICV